MRGRFIVVEGVDGAGKSTLARALVERLRAAGVPVVQVREPGGTPVAEAARGIVLDPRHDLAPPAELFLLLAARADLVARVIRPALEAGQVVVSDRFDLSTEAYQIAGRRMPRDGVLAANRLATGGLRPDLTLVLDVPAELGRRRLAAAGKTLDRLEQEAADFAERVGRAFAAAAGPDIVHLDGARPVADVATAAWDAVLARLSETLGVSAG